MPPPGATAHARFAQNPLIAEKAAFGQPAKWGEFRCFGKAGEASSAFGGAHDPALHRPVRAAFFVAGRYRFGLPMGSRPDTQSNCLETSGTEHS